MSHLSNFLLWPDWGLCEGEATGIFDLNKAFDTISHDILISKLGKYSLNEIGMRGVKKWLEIYTYQVLINGSLSKWKGVLSDILQESVLSLHLFNIFITRDDGIGSMFIKFAEDMEQEGTTGILKIQNELVYWRDILKISRKMNGIKFVREKKQSK